MTKRNIAVSTLCMLMLIIVACHKDAPEKVETPFPGFKAPSNFPATVYDFEKNGVTKEGFELGRKLFYDPILSRNNTISCGSCHLQSAGFTHHGHDISHGIDDRLGKRNTPAIMNLAWSKSFMADGGIFDLDLQPIAPITTFEEMDATMPNVIAKLQQDKDYPALFQNAFGSSTITSANFLKALSQFMLMCVSSNSKYDSVMRKEGPAFTSAELEGYNLYKQKCSQCHTEPLFTDNSFRNNGIGIGFNGDVGRFAVTLNEADKYKFKVPGLRNLQYTPPYMHDGRFYTLDAVLEEYASHVEAMLNLDTLLQQNGTYGIPLTKEEQTKILAFLKTLNDRHFVTDPMLAEQ